MTFVHEYMDEFAQVGVKEQFVDGQCLSSKRVDAEGFWWIKWVEE